MCPASNEQHEPILPATANGRPVILFDGVCNLCSGSVQFAIARDPKARQLCPDLTPQDEVAAFRTAFCQ